MTRYIVNVRCRECQHLHRSDAHDASFYNSFPSEVCRKCGHHGFEDSIERYVSTMAFSKPSTWFTGRWEKARF